LESKENALKLAEAALDHSSSLIQAEAIQIFAKLNPESAMKWIQSNTQPLPTVSQQAVVLSLGSIPGDTADNLLLSQLEGLGQHGGANNPAALEILQAADAKMRSTGREGFRSPLGQALRAYRNEAKDKSELGPFEVALNGGNASLGRNVFFNKIETQCVRCHQAGGEGASVVGPNLLGLGSRKSRLEILEAVALPNASIAEGFENVAVEMKNGDFLAGVLKKSTDTGYLLEVPKSKEAAEEFGDFEDAFSEEEDEPQSDLAHGNGDAPGAEVIETEIIELTKGDVASITRGPSGMPAGLANMLSLAELRDLIEYLATQ
jgi:quinoprotein glucose dehydrogenase